MLTAADFDEQWADVPPPDDPLDGDDLGRGDDVEPVLGKLLLTRSDLNALPDPQPLIRGVLDQGTVSLLYGKWGTGKSFLGVDWGCSVSTGRAWQNRACEQQRVLYVAAEGAFGLKGRVRAWETGWGQELSDAAFHVLPRPVNLTRAVDIADLIALVHWNGYGLLILDTLSRCMVGADENSAKDCGQVVDVLHRLREHTPGGRGVVLGVHHAGKDGKTFRGSSAFEAGADTVYSVIGDEDDGSIVLTREKRKDGPLNDIHRLKLDPIEGSESCVISVHRGGGQTERADKLLSTFVHHFADNGASKSELRNVAELPPATFHRALSDLLKSGDVVNIGTEKRPFYKVAAQ
ncbi:AAA family ATPase [Mycobacterium intracellulare]|uniref:AAA family ATPase n=1 Tax=Mycobacterium intracellulare TaxID=1767 RepID=UPI001444DF0D|nr:AAA family ATPase [Mycobacterium intracellulare]